MTVRYAAVPPRPAPAEGSGGSKGANGSGGIATWSTSLAATFLTDPEAVASVLPPPLSPPDEPIVKVGISRVDLGGRMPPFGAGTFAVAARHGDLAGFYPLLISLALGAANNNTVQASARAALASGTAILTLPLLLGSLADAVGIQPAYSVVIVLLLAMFLMVQAASRYRLAVQPA